MGITDPEAWTRVMEALSLRARLAFSQLDRDEQNSINICLLKDELKLIRSQAFTHNKPDLIESIDLYLQKIADGFSKIKRTFSFYYDKQDEGPFEFVVESLYRVIKKLSH